MASGTGVAERPGVGRGWIDACLGALRNRRSSLLVVVSLITLAFVSPVLIAGLVLGEPGILFWAVLIADLVALFAFATGTYTRPALFIGVLVLWFALQRLVVAAVAPHVDPDMVRVLLTYKEGYYFILPASAVAALALRRRRREQALTPLLLADVIAVTWLGILALHFLAAGDPSTPELTYARRFAAPVLLYAGGRLLLPSLGQITSGLRLVIVIALGVALFGLLERFALGVGFWIDGVDAAEFYGRQVESGLLPRDWTVIYRGVPDGIFISLPLETPVRRLVSTYLEPTTLGSFLAFALLMLLLAPALGAEQRGISQRLATAAVCVLTLAVLATLSRGAMVTVLAGGALFVGARLAQDRRKLGELPLALGSVVAVAMTIGFVVTTFSSFPGDAQVRDLLETRTVSGLSDEPTPAVAPAPPDTSPPDPAPPPQAGPLEEIEVHPPGSTAEGASKHLDGLESGLNRMLEKPLGSGLGAAGNWSDESLAGGESAVGVVAAQTGVPGLIAYFAFYGAAVAGLLTASWRRRGPAGDVALVLAGALFGLFVVSFVSESAFGLLGNAPYFIFAGWVLAVATPASRRFRFSALPPASGDGDDWPGLA